MAPLLDLVFIAIYITSIRSVSAIDSHFSTFSSSPPTESPPAFTFLQDVNELKPQFSFFSSITPILSELGYHRLAMAAHALSSSVSVPWIGPVTFFAPADSSVRTCPSCSISLLLQEHTVPGLYPFDYLKKLPFGTKIETILGGRCLTVTSSVNSTKFFVGGAEITRPDLFNNGHVIIHGVQGYISHLSPHSCSIDKMTSLSLPMQSPVPSLIRLMLADTMIRLRTSGYSVLALALRVKYPELVNLHNMTIFALNDAAIFHGGHAYVHDVKFHIVPNNFLKHTDLEAFPAATVLPTLLPGKTLTITTGGGEGLQSPLRINYIRIKIPDLLYNLKIVVHGLSLPFPHLQYTASMTVNSGRSGFIPIENGLGSEGQEQEPLGKAPLRIAPSPAIESTVEMDYHHGL